MTSCTALVVGGGGFLGRAVVRALSTSGRQVVVPRVRWDEPEQAAADLVDAVRALRADGGPWSLVWCAGTGIVATGADAFAAEAALLDAVLDPAVTAPDTTAPGTSTPTVFFASSAGAVYAGSDGVPFDETSEPRPLAPYGTSRLQAEDRFRAWADAVGARALVGRIANLYGPGANLAKPQGLVSQLALAHVQQRPSSLYVPLDTTRDYLYIDDAAAMVTQALDLVGAAPGPHVTKVFASQQGHTIQQVVDAVAAAFGTELDVRTGDDPSASVQGRDLRFRSVVLPEVDRHPLLPFDEGVRRTVADVAATATTGTDVAATAPASAPATATTGTDVAATAPASAPATATATATATAAAATATDRGAQPR